MRARVCVVLFRGPQNVNWIKVHHFHFSDYIFSILLLAFMYVVYGL